MAIETLRPNSTTDLAAWTRTGGSTAHGVLADDSDATYLTSGFDNTDIAKFALTGYTLAAGEAIRQLRIRARMSSDSAIQGIGEAQLDIGGEQLLTATMFGKAGTSPQTYNSGWSADPLDPFFASYAGSHQAVIDQAAVWLQNLDGSSSYEPPRVYEAYVDVDVWQRTAAPTVATDPSGTSNTTDQPTISSYVGAVNDGTPSLWSREIRVFRDEVYHAGGFDPATESDVEWEQVDTGLGSIASSAASPHEVQVGTPLANDTYRAYVRYGKNMPYQTLWSEWAYAEVVVSVTPPDAPTVDVTVDQIEGRQEITVTTAALANVSVERVRVERSTDEGATWETIRGGLLTDVAGATAYTLYDRDAPRDTDLQYRARTVEIADAVTGATLTSDWTTSGVVVHPNDGRWWLYDVGRWTSVIGGARVETDPQIQVESDLGVFYPLGREGEAVAVTGTSHGDDGAYTIRATGADQCGQLDAMARHTGTVLVKSPFGEQKYLVWISRTRTLRGTPASPGHTWDLEYVEVDAGIDEDGT